MLPFATTIDGEMPGAMRDHAGRWTYYDYDPLKRPIRVQDPTGNTLEMKYDAGGNLTRLLDAKGNATRFAYAREIPVD